MRRGPSLKVRSKLGLREFEIHLQKYGVNYCSLTDCAGANYSTTTRICKKTLARSLTCHSWWARTEICFGRFYRRLTATCNVVVDACSEPVRQWLPSSNHWAFKWQLQRKLPSFLRVFFVWINWSVFSWRSRSVFLTVETVDQLTSRVGRLETLDIFLGRTETSGKKNISFSYSWNSNQWTLDYTSVVQAGQASWAGPKHGNKARHDLK